MLLCTMYDVEAQSHCRILCVCVCAECNLCIIRMNKRSVRVALKSISLARINITAQQLNRI